jgi:hypothetical protein
MINIINIYVIKSKSWKCDEATFPVNEGREKIAIIETLSLLPVTGNREII